MVKKVAVLVVLIIIVAAAWLLAGTKNPTPNTNNTSSTASNSSSSANQTNPSPPQPVATNSVEMLNVAFSPANITVKKGTTVTWTNQDAVEHTVTENDGKNGPNAPPLNQGQSYTFAFNEVGTFHYHCTIHTEMSGTVTVTTD